MRNKMYLVLMLVLALLAVMPFAMAAGAPEGAVFGKINLHQGYPTDLEKTDSLRNDQWYLDESISAEKVWMYQSSNPTDNLMYAPVLVYFADVDTDEEAWMALDATGIWQKAEELQGYAVVIGKNDGDTFSENDKAIYKALEIYLLGEGTPIEFGGEVIPWSLSFDQRTFLVAEGEAATFVNDYLTDSMGRIAGVLLVGGDMNADGKEEGLAVPAYLADASEEVLAYYKNVNGVDIEEETSYADVTVYYNSANDVCQVAVDTENVLNSEMVDRFWEIIGKVTCRMCLDTSIYTADNYYSATPFVLTKLPDADGLNYTVFSHTEGVLEGAAEICEWYEYVPNAILEDDSEVVYPLIVVNHGSQDHPQFEAESQGFVEYAARNNYIVLTLRHQTLSEETVADDILKLIDYTIEKYPIDESRIYIAGFSMGGMRVGQVLRENAEKFAGAILMHTSIGVGTDKDGNGISDEFQNIADEVDIPIYYQLGEYDSTFDGDSQMQTIEQITALNNIEITTSELNAGDCFGINTVKGGDETWESSVNGMTYTLRQLENEEGVPLVEMAMLQGAAHVHFSGNATQAMEYLSQFSRNSDGTLAYSHSSMAAE